MPPSSPSGRVVIPAAHGQLEGILRAPSSAVAAAVVCHPHPRGGGTMNNNVVYRAAKALVAGGVTALRFNFRGVGASTGSYGEGVGEEEDVRAAVDFLRAQAPGLAIWIAGFSFGARVGLTVRARVLENSGVRLQWEIKRIGDFKRGHEVDEFLGRLL